MLLSFTKMLEGWKKSMLIVSLIPMLLLGVSLINYGIVFNPFFAENGSSFEFLKLPNLFSFFDSNVALPTVVKIIGRGCVTSLGFIFIIWLVLFTITCYLKLSQQIDNKVELTTELVIMSLVYFHFISPSSTISFTLGLLLIVVNLGLILLYWIYELKSKK